MRVLEDIQIRPAIPSDVAQIIALCKEHAAYERAAYYPEGKQQLLAKDLFDTDGGINCLVAAQPTAIMAYATFMKQYSTWDAAYYVYLDCLFIQESKRGMGIGKKMMDRVRHYAKNEQCNMIQWQTPEFNEKAITFYRKLGATQKTKARFYWELT